MRIRSFPARRSLLVVVALALAAVVAVTLPASAGASKRAVLPKAGEGGKLVYANSLPSLWDPVYSTAGTDINSLSLVYSGLTKLDVHGNPVPDIASAWKWSKNGLSITFTLRPHLVYSDGAPLDAKSVKTNILRGRDDPKSLIAPQLTPVKAVHTPNATTVTLVLNQPDWDLPRILAGKTGELVSPKAIASNTAGLATQPVGAGPFKLTNLVSGSSATLVRNPTYWDAKDVLLSELDLQFITNPQTVVAALKTGSVNFAWITTNTTVPSLLNQKGIAVQVVPSLRVNSIEVNAAMAPFTNPKIVQAVNYAIDRKTLLNTIWDNIGKVSYQAFPRGYVGYSEAAANLYPYNPARAKALIAASGLPTPIAFPITYFDYGPYKALAEALQSELNAVGFNTSLVDLPLAQAGTAVYVNHSVAFNPNGISGRESPLQMLEIQYAKDGLLNPCRCAPSKLTALFNKVASTPTDSPNYPTLLQQATALSAETSANIFLTTQPWVYARSTKVQGLQPYLVAQRFEDVYVES